LHQHLDRPDGANKKADLAGAPLQPIVPPVSTLDEKRPFSSHDSASTPTKAGIPSEEDDGLGGVRPTDEEKKTLRHVAEPLPKAAFLVAIVELCERFTYYGASGIFQNYVKKPLDGSEGRGALGMGHQGATGLTTFFQFWCYG
jgi:POT family proton-dependent oligopeptide transporter